MPGPDHRFGTIPYRSAPPDRLAQVLTRRPPTTAVRDMDVLRAQSESCGAAARLRTGSDQGAGLGLSTVMSGVPLVTSGVGAAVEPRWRRRVREVSVVFDLVRVLDAAASCS